MTTGLLYNPIRVRWDHMHSKATNGWDMMMRQSHAKKENMLLQMDWVALCFGMLKYKISPSKSLI